MIMEDGEATMMDKLNKNFDVFMKLEDMDEKEIYKVNLKLETQHFIINYSEFDRPCIDMEG